MTQTNPLVRKFAKGASYLKRHGGRMTAARLLQWLGNQIANSGKGKGKGQYPLGMLVKFADAAALDWVSEPDWKKDPRPVGEGPYVTAWIMSPPGESSGGHQNIFRFLSYLEAAGHRVKIFLYWSQSIPVNADRVRDMIERSSNYPNLKATYALYDPAVGVGDDVDAIFATGWETAYPAYLARAPAASTSSRTSSPRSTRSARRTSSPKTPTASVSRHSPRASGWPPSSTTNTA